VEKEQIELENRLTEEKKNKEKVSAMAAEEAAKLASISTNWETIVAEKDMKDNIHSQDFTQDNKEKMKHEKTLVMNRKKLTETSIIKVNTTPDEKIDTSTGMSRSKSSSNINVSHVTKSPEKTPNEENNHNEPEPEENNHNEPETEPETEQVPGNLTRKMSDYKQLLNVWVGPTAKPKIKKISDPEKNHKGGLVWWEKVLDVVMGEEDYALICGNCSSYHGCVPNEERYQDFICRSCGAYNKNQIDNSVEEVIIKEKEGKIEEIVIEKVKPEKKNNNNNNNQEDDRHHNNNNNQEDDGHNRKIRFSEDIIINENKEEKELEETPNIEKEEEENNN